MDIIPHVLITLSTIRWAGSDAIHVRIFKKGRVKEIPNAINGFLPLSDP